MTWHCADHGEVIPQATGTSYRCPCCTARVVWRSSAREQIEAFDELEEAAASAARTRANWMHREADQAEEEG